MRKKFTEWLFGKDIPTKIGMFTNKKGHRIAPVITSSFRCYGYVSEKNITFVGGDVLDNAYIGSFSESFIKQLEGEGLIFTEYDWSKG